MYPLASHGVRNFCLLVLIFLCNTTAFTQQTKKNTYTIQGKVKDKITGEFLIGAAVTILGRDDNSIHPIATKTNAYGLFSIDAPVGEHLVLITFYGRSPDSIIFPLHKDTSLTCYLSPMHSNLEDVVVSSTRSTNVKDPTTGVVRMTIQELNAVPVFFGEKDIMKTLQLLPGIQSGGDGSSGFTVRGGNIDQNLILLDEAVVYNPSHLLGFFSTFNSDAVKEVELYKGAMPAKYGGRLASVVDVKMNDGSDQSYKVSGGIGLISSRIAVEGPIVKDKGAFMLTGRRTYADMFLKLSPDSNFNKAKLYFYDINGKASYNINDNNRVFFSIYSGHDVMGFGDQFGIDWGNLTITARLNTIVSKKLFMNTSIIHSNYNYLISINTISGGIGINSVIDDWTLKEDMEYNLGINNKLLFGINSIYHKMSPGSITGSGNFGNLTTPDKHAWENGAYIEHIYSPTQKLQLDYGLHLSIFSLLGGSGNFYTYDNNGNAIDTFRYAQGQFVKTYINPEPRFSMSYQLSRRQSVKWSYTRSIQNIHLLSNTTTGNPTDIWIPSSNNLKAEIGDQISFGYYRNFKNSMFEFSSEVYWKWMQNQIDYKNGAQLIANTSVESELLTGVGRAYGLEILLKKTRGKFTGWISYTLSRTERLINGINNNQWYAANQNRTNNIAIVGIYQASKTWSVSGTWVYYTGNAISYPSGKYQIEGQVVNLYGARNAYTMPAYHRMDVSATYDRPIRHAGKTGHITFQSSWNFSIFNLYGRENPYSIAFQTDPNNSQKTQAVQTSLFRWVPSITYNFKFY